MSHDPTFFNTFVPYFILGLLACAALTFFMIAVQGKLQEIAANEETHGCGFPKTCGSITLTDGSEMHWVRMRLSQEKFAKGWGSYDEGVLEMYKQYYCPKCKGEVEPGPSGAGTNQVCRTCNINYGCLPGALER